MTEIVPVSTQTTKPLGVDEQPLKLGLWVWRREEKRTEPLEPADYYHHGPLDGETEFECVVEIGSNYVALNHAGGHHDYATRVHLDEFDGYCRPEPDPKGWIDGRVGQCKTELNGYLREVQEIVANLGLQETPALPNSKTNPGSYALAVLSGQDNIDDYKQALIKAKKDELPALFKKMEETNKDMATWMSADILPLQAQAGQLSVLVERIESRVFNVELYAGLTEQVEQIADGKPAEIDEPLHILQDRRYMDEEILLAYKTGGMNFEDLGEFDHWLCQPENVERILPFPRTLVCFRVRRYEKEYASSGTIADFIHISMQQKEDFKTFLYIRNGERVYRLNSKLEFGSALFPDKNGYDPKDYRWAHIDSGKVKSFLSQGDYDAVLKHRKERERDKKKAQKQHERWSKLNPGKHWMHSPFHSAADRWDSSDRDQYEPFDASSVYYDDMRKKFDLMVQAYNRIALIVQGLFDRSTVLHPHHPVKTWTADGYAKALRLVYDSQSLRNGPPPDFEAYRNELNKKLGVGSVVYGQEDFWQRAEAVIENERRKKSNSRRRYNDHENPVTHCTPPGNPGPGLLASIVKWSTKNSAARFKWMRQKGRRQYYYDDEKGTIPDSIEVPADKLFNVSAYVPGDFLKFFWDPVTRADYLKWAPALLTAEEFLAGNIQVGVPEDKVKLPTEIERREREHKKFEEDQEKREKEDQKWRKERAEEERKEAAENAIAAAKAALEPDEDDDDEDLDEVLEGGDDE